MQPYPQQRLWTGFVRKIHLTIKVEELVQALSKCQPNREGEHDKGTRGKTFPHPPLEAKALQALRDMAGEDASVILASVIDAYLKDAPKLLQAIGKGITQGDAAALYQAAHTLKSSSATLGAMTFTVTMPLHI